MKALNGFLVIQRQMTLKVHNIYIFIHQQYWQQKKKKNYNN